jgi:hypothetical protein
VNVDLVAAAIEERYSSYSQIGDVNNEWSELKTDHSSGEPMSAYSSIIARIYGGDGTRKSHLATIFTSSDTL